MNDLMKNNGLINLETTLEVNTNVFYRLTSNLKSKPRVFHVLNYVGQHRVPESVETLTYTEKIMACMDG